LRLERLSKTFDHKEIMKTVDFEFEKGKCYVVSGESGCGKTTMLNMIAGYLEPDCGCIKKEENVRVDYLFQDEILFSNLTVKENMFIKYTCFSEDLKSFEKDTLSILKKFNIDDLLNRKVALLSGGERQRVQLANVMLSRPDVVLMDEPTSKLDKENKEQIIESINSNFKDKTLIIVSHEHEEGYENVVKLKLKGGQLMYEV